MGRENRIKNRKLVRFIFVRSRRGMFVFCSLLLSIFGFRSLRVCVR